MGALSFLSGRTVYLDTSILIYVVEHHSRYSPLLQPLVDAAASGELELLTSELTALETLILPLRSGDAALVQRYHEALFESELRVVPITRAVVLEAAHLRAQHPALRTPDAIHWATMRLEGADYLLTNDARLAQTVGAAAVYLESLC
jgi:predicted nucleic acid-binding protein